MELLQGDSPRPDLAVLWAQELTTNKGKAELLTAAVVVQAKTDPMLAASYGSGLTGRDQIVFNNRLVSSWSQTQPEAAWQWSNALDDPTTRAQARSAAIIARSENDPQGAIARLSLLPDSSQRTETLKAVAASYANKNTDAAMAWAQTLPPAEMPVANDAINRVAPVGVGIMASLDEEGYTVIRGLMPNMGAEQSGDIHPGDRIVGVTRGNNQFVDPRQVDAGELFDLIRGGPVGSAVQIQIAPALPGGGYGPPTVVSIVRQQTKHGG